MNPERHSVAIENKKQLDGFALREIALTFVPNALINYIPLNIKPGQIYEAQLMPILTDDSDDIIDLEYSAIQLNPYTGELLNLLSDQEQSLWPLTQQNILDFIYKLHQTLLLNQIGLWLLGSAALIWFFHSLIGIYLTLPINFNNLAIKPFFQRWSVAWRIKHNASPYRFFFDWHRATGLWLAIMLLIFAASAVSFNLRKEVYEPLVFSLFGPLDMTGEPKFRLAETQAHPNLDWRQAHLIGQILMSQQAGFHHFKILSEQSLQYLPEQALFKYTVQSNLDISNKIFATHLYFDANTAQFYSLYLPSTSNIGATLTRWLFSLHTATFGGLYYQIIVCLIGIMLVLLSLSGIYIWLKKRNAKKSKRQKQTQLKNL